MTQQESPISPVATSANTLKKWGQLLLRRFRINTHPTVKVYHGFGTSNHMEISGHVLRVSPMRQEKFSTRFWRNTLSLLRLFVVKPYTGATVELTWGTQKVQATTNETGHFHAIWEPNGMVEQGWHDVAVTLISGKYAGTTGHGKLLVPPPTKYAVASDIDDTFLISHSSDLWRRLYVLLTSNARTRQPFEGVVEHYQLLAQGDQDDNLLRPFFYVSSSEWNLYDYIREFTDNYQLPNGVYLLSTLKQLQQFWKTGQGKHKAKYFRLARLLTTYPEKKFILLGDDSQEDPSIYTQLVHDFPDRIVCVYLRHVHPGHLAATNARAEEIRAAGVEICYFTHSKTAIAHSRKMGLIE